MFRRLNELRRGFFDVRQGELGRTVFVSLYLLFILLAYYILKPVSRALFLNKFDLDKVPLLYMLLAPAGGAMAFLYSRLTLTASLKTAVSAASAFAILMTVSMGYLLYTRWDWVFYAFNIWVSMFSIMMVTQGWVIASNVFTAREAKRLYGILGLGAVTGAFLGGTYTKQAVQLVGENNLILTSAAFTAVAYLMYRMLLLQPGVELGTVKASAEEGTEFSVGDIAGDIRRNRHLTVIVGIVLLTFIVDVMVEYQFQAFAKAKYSGRDLTAFMGSFHGVYLNLVNFVFQFFLTAAVVRWLGVGGVLQIMPVTIGAASIAIFSMPGVWSTSLARLLESASRYTFNRTGMELLYLPLPLELRNRTKAFLDIFVDRLGRGVGGVVLWLLTVQMGIAPQQLSLVVIGFCIVWALLSASAQREYTRSVRRRLESRTLDLESLRVQSADPQTIAMLEAACAEDNPRQALYALSILASLPDYDLEPRIAKGLSHRAAEVRAKCFALAAERSLTCGSNSALAELRQTRGENPAAVPAVECALALADQPLELAGRLLTHPAAPVAEAAVRWLAAADGGSAVLTPDWISAAAQSPDPRKRRHAAIAMGGNGRSNAAVEKLLGDAEVQVKEAAIDAAGRLRDRALVPRLASMLADLRLRGSAAHALAAYGSGIAGTLRDLMEDSSQPRAVRLKLPRVLAMMGEQRAADELLLAVGTGDLDLRGAVLAALSRMRREQPQLSFGAAPVEQQILEEAKAYYAMWAALEPLRPAGDLTALRLLRATLDERLRQMLDRLFLLLGLRYEQRGVERAAGALKGKSHEDHSAAIEFLESLLDRDLKRILIPLVDDAPRIAARAKELFGIDVRSPEEALRRLLQSGDAWLVSCAAQAAAELKLRGLQPQLEALRGRSGDEVERVLLKVIPAFA